MHELVEHTSFERGDFVMFVGLASQELIGQVLELLETGRYCIEMGAHTCHRKVCIKLANLQLVEFPPTFLPLRGIHWQNRSDLLVRISVSY